jgi:hypothetical protein
MYLNDVGIVTMPFERGLENDRPRKRESVWRGGRGDAF